MIAAERRLVISPLIAGDPHDELVRKRFRYRIASLSTLMQWTLGMGDLRCFDSAWLRSASQTTSAVVYLARIQITEDNVDCHGRYFQSWLYRPDRDNEVIR